MKQNDEQILQLRDAAALLGLRPSTVRWMVDTGRLPAFRTPSGQRLLRRGDVMAEVAARDAARQARGDAA